MSRWAKIKLVCGHGVHDGALDQIEVFKVVGDNWQPCKMPWTMQAIRDDGTPVLMSDDPGRPPPKSVHGCYCVNCPVCKRPCRIRGERLDEILYMHAVLFERGEVTDSIRLDTLIRLAQGDDHLDL